MSKTYKVRDQYSYEILGEFNTREMAEQFITILVLQDPNRRLRSDYAVI